MYLARHATTVLLLLALASSAGISRAEKQGGPHHPPAKGGNVVLQWIAAGRAGALKEPVLDGNALILSRYLAILSTAIYDAWAVVASGGAATPLYYEAGGDKVKRLDVDKVISFAAYKVLDDFWADSTTATYAVPLLAKLGYSSDDTTSREAKLGLKIGTSVLQARANDGSNAANGYADTTGYKPVNGPLDYAQSGNPNQTDPNRFQLIFVKGVLQKPVSPQWGGVKPFLSDDADSYLPPPPAKYPSNVYTKQAEEVIHLSASLNDRRKVIVEYWALGSGTPAVEGKFNEYAAAISRRDHHDLAADAQLFFALNTALADARIAAYGAKYVYDAVRPASAIRFLFADKTIRAFSFKAGGTADIKGADFTPYLTTPGHPEYPSGHSSVAGAGGAILKLFTGSSAFRASAVFKAGASTIQPGVVPAADVELRWRSIDAIVKQIGISRRYGGVHFKAADLEGQRLGADVAGDVWAAAQELFGDAAT